LQADALARIRMAGRAGEIHWTHAAEEKVLAKRQYLLLPGVVELRGEFQAI
jgi:hypothetical protein